MPLVLSLSTVFYHFHDKPIILCYHCPCADYNLGAKVERSAAMEKLTEQEKLFLRMVHDPDLRRVLLERLEKLGLLSAFLQAETGTS